MSSTWFDEARLGLFIHYGLYSLVGARRGEWEMWDASIPAEVYNQRAAVFNADRFDADQLVALAKRSGMRYAVLTARHHDGFCLYPTRTRAPSVSKSACRRDLIGEFVQACRRGGLRVGLYYSLMSWQHRVTRVGPRADPHGWKAMIDEAHAQVAELMTDYGRIDMLWYDGAVVPGEGDSGSIAAAYGSAELNAMVRRLQPRILINDRSALPEDFSTPEQHVTPARRGRRWEACMTLHSMWGWRADETWYRPIGEIVGSLLTCARFGGNLLLNIGPRGDGSIDKPFTDRLQQLGDWLSVNGEAIYGSRRTAMSEVEHPLGVRTCVGSRIYQVLNQRRGGRARLAGPFPERTTARLLGGTRLRARTGSDGVVAIEGLPRAKPGLPRVIRLNMRHRSTARRPSALLLLPTRAAIRPDEVPNLGVDPGRFQQDPAEVVCGDALADRILTTVRSASSIRWCSGWQAARVLSGNGGVDLDIRPPGPGRYRLEVGVICDSTTIVSASTKGRSIARLVVPERLPDMVSAELRLDGGEVLHLRSQGRLGVYGLRLEPVPTQIPSECWLTFGHLPTGFRVGCDAELAVRQALRAVRVVPTSGWRRSRIRMGDHSEAGVNFPYRCGPGAGICLARTRITSPTERKATVWIGCDWWANVLLNGEAVIGGRDPQATARDGATFNGWKPEPAKINLRAGNNDLVVISHPGSIAHWFTCCISDPGDLRITNRGLDAGATWGQTTMEVAS